MQQATERRSQVLVKLNLIALNFWKLPVYIVIDLIALFFPSIDGDEEVAARLASTAAEAMLNGTECDDARHKSPTHGSATGSKKTLLLVNENGTSDTEPPHGSVTGSNGFILTKQQQEDGSAATPGLGVSPHRTNWLPSGSPAGGSTAKPLPALASGCAQSLGALRTDPSMGTTSGQGTPDTKNGTAPAPTPAPAPVTIHRARKTMSRPAVSAAQKVKPSECGASSAAHLCYFL